MLVWCTGLYLLEKYLTLLRSGEPQVDPVLTRLEEKDKEKEDRTGFRIQGSHGGGHSSQEGEGELLRS